MTVVIAALGLAGCLGPGVAVSNKSVGYGPGLWRSLGGNDCFWARLRSFTGDPTQDVIASGGSVHGVNFNVPIVSPGGPQYVQVDASDAGFEQSGCIPFWRQDPPGPWARDIAANPSSVGPGDYLVGREIPPGTYQTQVGTTNLGFTLPDCRWARVRGFHHTAGDDIETASFSNSHGPIQTISVTIQPSDFGFSSFGCGPFTKVG